MNWKKVLIAVTLTGITVLSAASCGNSAGTTTAVTTIAADPTETTTAVEKPTRPADGERIAPPTENGTMPAPRYGEMPAMPEIDWAAAAEKLGVTGEALKAAVGDIEEGRPDMEAAAATLGVTAEELMEALGFTGGPPQGNPPEGTQPPAEE